MPELQQVTVENYLLALYSMEEEETPLQTSRLAQRIHVSPASVTGMLRRMGRDGLVNHQERALIQLTEKGREQARSITRRHRLAERFLMEVLGLLWHEVHEEAHRLEHAISPTLEQRISALLGHPATCPHGNPIPGNSPGIAADAFRLERAAPAAMVILDHVTDEVEDDLPAMEFLYRHGLLPGAVARVVEVTPFNGTLTLQIEEAPPVTLGLALAAKIWARPWPPTTEAPD